MSATFDLLCVILVHEHRLKADSLTLETPLDSLGIDSLGAVELLWNVEGAFGIRLPSEPVELESLGDVVRYIDEIGAVQMPKPRLHRSLPPSGSSQNNRSMPVGPAGAASASRG